MRRIAWRVKNWMKLAKITPAWTSPFADSPATKSLYDLYLDGWYSKGTLWNILFASIKTRRNWKPVKESLLKATREHTYVYMTNEEILERDRHWADVYPSMKALPQEDEWKELGVMGDLRNFEPKVEEEEEEDDEEDD